MRFIVALIFSSFIFPDSSPSQHFGYASYGDPGCMDHYVPTFHTDGEVVVPGNTGFRVAMDNLHGGSSGFLWLSARLANLPIGAGLVLHVDPAVGLALPFRAGGSLGVGGAGSALVPLPLPADPHLVGLKLYLQGIAFSSSPVFSLVHTHGLALTMLPSVPAALEALQDRGKYLALFSGMSPIQAEQLGQAIWAARPVRLFRYLRTEQFTCGGQSHWIVIALHVQTGIEFCLIPGGTFRMGDIHRTGWVNEQPVRHVRIAPFLISRTEVTQAQWRATAGSSPWLYFSRFINVGPDYPAVAIRWNHATDDFCRRTGLRLPTEAEWEYACRAGVDNCFFFGENYPPANLDLYAWSLSNVQPQWGAREVAQLAPNAFGLFDMLGNVSEWVDDSWHGGYECAPVDGRAREGNPLSRVFRGGSWRSDAWNCRTSIRGGNSNLYRQDYLGFRLASTW